MIESYILLMPFIRKIAQRVKTKTGRDSTRPTYIAVTWCSYEEQPGIMTSNHPKGQRWACHTCMNFAEPIHTDNEDKCPSADEALHEYTAWAIKKKGAQPWKKGMMGNDVKPSNAR